MKRVPSRRLPAVLVVLPVVLSGCAWLARASVDVTGDDANGGSFFPSLSADGRFAAFTSAASDLVPGDSNATTDVFVRDLRTGLTRRVSVDAQGGDPNGHSESPVISADGRYVAFTSTASDLVPDGDGCCTDVFVHDLQTEATTRIGTASGADPDAHSFNPALSSDGRYVAFESWASDLVPGDGNGVVDVFVHDRRTGLTTRASTDIGGGDANGFSLNPSISGGGRSVVFESDASDLVRHDGNEARDVFVHDVRAGTTRRVSLDRHHGDANGASFAAALSADGRHVAFSSDASDLVRGDGTSDPFCWDLFVRDLDHRRTTRLSVDVAGDDPECDSLDASISADGRQVAFTSLASDLVADDTNGVGDVFVHDVERGTTTRVSGDVTFAEVSAESRNPSISADGRYVAFDSTSSELDPDDGNGTFDVFVRAVSRPTVEKVTPPVIHRGTTRTLVLTGAGFGPGTSVATSLFAPDGVTVESVTVISTSRLRVVVTAAEDAPRGPRNLYVRVPGPSPGVFGIPGSSGVCGACLRIV
jgi:Tol biopolymer transport system component